MGNAYNVGNPTTLLGNDAILMGLFGNTQRYKRRHGHHSYKRPSIHDATLDLLLPSSID